MAQAYSDPTRADDPHALPDVEVFELTAMEVAEMDEDLVSEYQRRHEYRLAAMNSKVREDMLIAIIDEEQIKGAWYWWECFPGCLPDSPPIGPYDTYDLARDDSLTGNNSGYRV